MKRIAVYVPTLRSGGAEKQATILAAMLSSEHEVHLITLDSRHEDHAPNVRRLEMSSVIRHFIYGNAFSKVRQLRSILSENKIDVMFNYLTTPDVLGCYAGRRAGVGKIYNGIRNSQLPYTKFIFEKYVHNRWATGTVFNCQSGLDAFVSRGFRRDRCIFIPNCYPDVSPPVSRPDKREKEIITVGRFVPQKDYLTAIKAIAVLHDRKDFRFNIVGYGVLEKQIRRWIVDYGIQGCTTVSINPPNVKELLSNADIYLSTSLFEGTSNSIMEALDFSLPVVCTDAGDNYRLVRDGVNGYLHRTRDYTAIANSLGRLLEDPSMRNDFGREGNSLLRDNFSTALFISRYSELL